MFCFLKSLIVRTGKGRQGLAEWEFTAPNVHVFGAEVVALLSDTSVVVILTHKSAVKPSLTG